MKFLLILSLAIFFGCSLTSNSDVKQHGTVAYDEMAEGNVKASAVKKVSKEEICFDITLAMKGVDQREAQASNWTLAWVDENSRYHLLSMNQRQPASLLHPSAKQEWTNQFKSCTPKADLEQVKSIILTPKELSYKEVEGMRLEWN